MCAEAAPAAYNICVASSSTVWWPTWTAYRCPGAWPTTSDSTPSNSDGARHPALPHIVIAWRGHKPQLDWVPAVPSSVTLVPAYIELDQKVPARTRQVEEGLSHNSEVSASRSHVAVCGEPCVRAERDRQDLISPWRLDPGLHSLACPNHLNSVYSPSPGFSICWVGQAPYPSGEQPVCFWESISQRN